MKWQLFISYNDITDYFLLLSRCICILDKKSHFENVQINLNHLYFDNFVKSSLIFIISFSAKSQELKKDIEILSQTFERVIDRKEAIIKSLVKDIEEAEEQYQMALRSHLQNVDRLIGNVLTVRFDRIIFT